MISQQPARHAYCSNLCAFGHIPYSSFWNTHTLFFNLLTYVTKIFFFIFELFSCSKETKMLLFKKINRLPSFPNYLYLVLVWCICYK